MSLQRPTRELNGSTVSYCRAALDKGARSVQSLKCRGWTGQAGAVRAGGREAFLGWLGQFGGLEEGVELFHAPNLSRGERTVMPPPA